MVTITKAADGGFRATINYRGEFEHIGFGDTRAAATLDAWASRVAIRAWAVRAWKAAGY